MLSVNDVTRVIIVIFFGARNFLLVFDYRFFSVFVLLWASDFLFLSHIDTTDTWKSVCERQQIDFILNIEPLSDQANEHGRLRFFGVFA